MKAFMIFMSLLTFGSLLTGGEIKKEFDTQPGELLEVDITTGGAIKVTGWTQEKVAVYVEFRGSKLDDDVWIDIEKTRSGVAVESGVDGHHSSERLSFEIFVPEKYDINIKTMGGDIDVKNVAGDLNGETMGGHIQLEELTGKVRFSTMGGNVELNDSDVDGKVSTMGGQVRFYNIVGDVDGSSMGGNVIYKNVRSRDGKSNGREVHISTMGGEVKVDEALSGADVSTMGGNIYVNKAAKFVKASTMGGNIEIKEIDGWVNANTKGGDVYVNMTGDPSKDKRDVSISSLGGDIELILPEDISAEFDIRLTYTRKSSQDYQIRSDFKLDIDGDREWDYRNGDVRKTINAKGITADGKNRIKISTINGDIIIKKDH